MRLIVNGSEDDWWFWAGPAYVQHLSNYTSVPYKPFMNQIVMRCIGLVFCRFAAYI